MIFLKTILKKNVIPIIFFTMELFFFIKYRNGDKEMFFMVWSFICIALILYGFFNSTYSYTISQAVGSESKRYEEISSSYSEKIDKISSQGEKKRRENTNGFIGIYIIFLLINIAGYVVFMLR